MVLDGEKDELWAVDQIEDQVIVQDELAEIVTLREQSFQPPEARPCLQRSDWMCQERTSRQGELAEGGNDVVEQPVEQAGESSTAFLTEEAPNGLQIIGEVLGEDGREPPTGHSARGAGARSGSGRP